MKKITQHSSFLDADIDFILAASVTHTCEIEGLTQAGIPGLIPLTPTLDAEYLSTQKVYALKEVAQTSKGVPTPALITRAAHLLAPFENLTVLDLGLTEKPQNCNLISFNITPSKSIVNGAEIDAKSLFYEGISYAKKYMPKSKKIVLAESTPSGTTTANAALLALGFEVENLFSSSYKNAPDSIKKSVLKEALSHIKKKMNPFEKLGFASDNMLIFCAGFTLEISKKLDIILAGGTQMAAMLLIMQTLAREEDLSFDASRISLCTTSWVYNDPHSDIEKLLALLPTPIEGYYADFDFRASSHPALKLYDEGEAKEGVGAGAALAYLLSHGFSKETITQKVEELLA